MWSLISPQPEYSQLRDAIHAYLDHDPDDLAWADIWRAVGAIMGEYQRDTFVEAVDVDESAKQASIRPLITGENDCRTPLSKPTATCLARLTNLLPATTQYSGLMMATLPSTPCTFTRAISNVSTPKNHYNRWFDLFDFARKWGLELSIMPKSWYDPVSTVHVVFHPPERYR